MKRFRLRLSTLLWLVAFIAAFLGGIRYGEYREAARTTKLNVPNIWLAPADFVANWKFEVQEVTP